MHIFLCRFELFRFKHNLYKLREERAIKPSTFGELVSSTLYEKRWVLPLACPSIVTPHGFRAVFLCM